MKPSDIKRGGKFVAKGSQKPPPYPGTKKKKGGKKKRGPPQPPKSLPTSASGSGTKKTWFNTGSSKNLNASQTYGNKKGKSLSSDKQCSKSWWRENWCCGCRICLAFVGILIPLYIMLIHPCDEKIVYEKDPVDLFIIVDGSASVSDEQFQECGLAAKSWVTAFDDHFDDLAVGMIQFSHYSEVTLDLTTDMNSVLQEFGTSDNPNYVREVEGGTEYLPALDHLKQQLDANRRVNSFALTLFITDGDPTDGWTRIRNSVNEIKDAHNVTFVGAMVGGQAASSLATNLYGITNCGDTPMEECDFFVFTENYETFRDRSTVFADSVSDYVGGSSTAVCDPGLWWLTLFLLLPLLCLLLVPFCVGKKNTVRRKGKTADLENPPPPAPNAPPTKAVPTGKKKQKYKWDTVATDHYLWNFQGGASPMKVNYGDRAPPSAPKDLSKGFVKRGVQTWEEPDGYTYEIIKEDQTLEEWAEKKASEVGQLCCCCCCFRKK